MHWIKHLTSFARQEFMVEIGHELGNATCYGVWLILERIGEAWTGSGRPELRLPTKEWWAITQLPQKKFNKLLLILQDHHVLDSQDDGKMLILRAPILLQLLDEGTRKRRKASGENPEVFRAPSDPDTDIKAEIKKEQNTVKGLSSTEKMNISSVLRKKGIAPESPLGEGWFIYLEKHQPRNPAGYLTHILKNNPHFDPRGDSTPLQTATTRLGQFQPVGEVLQLMGFAKQQNGP
ncbi:MAG: hypothetical protein HQK81_13280 [Desulfovibrionaceae bacterium]|nr:hypothetical protein [Magnetococcales bacterium]MBF0515016.1 hypothetical protein [Desulfovibrionaceae bacterium]